MAIDSTMWQPNLELERLPRWTCPTCRRGSLQLARDTYVELRVRDRGLMACNTAAYPPRRRGCPVQPLGTSLVRPRLSLVIERASRPHLRCAIAPWHVQLLPLGSAIPDPPITTHEVVRQILIPRPPALGDVPTSPASAPAARTDQPREDGPVGVHQWVPLRAHLPRLPVPGSVSIEIDLLHFPHGPSAVGADGNTLNRLINGLAQ